MRLPASLVAALFVLGVAVSATVVPGVFIIDDDNYLINVLLLREGRVTVANTEGLSPSRELLFFDPGPWTRAVPATPVASTAPPLYAPLALPFVKAGWRGLVALNTLAYLATIVLVFVYARQYAVDPLTPWLGAGAFALGGYMLEYAQGLWPQALSAALCFGGIAAVGRFLETDKRVLVVLGGALLALATGVRYQNAVVLAVAGAAVLMWARRRVRSAIAFGFAAAVPLSISAAINHARLGSWNPISKGPTYLNVPVLAGTSNSVFDPLIMFWARVVDFSVRPPLVGPLFAWVRYDPVTGAHLMGGETAQKAFLQSAPWAILAFMTFVLVWTSRKRVSGGARVQTRFLSIVTLAIVATFAFAGVYRHEGLAYNQRYLLELLPIVAVGFAWALDGLELRIAPIAAGACWGGLLVVLVLYALPSGTPRLTALFKIPLLLAAILAAVWLLGRSRAHVRPIVAGAVGLSLGWGFALHVGDDLRASHRRRALNMAATQTLNHAVPDHSALVCYWGTRDAAIPLLFDRDVVILDAQVDEGQDAPMLIHELLTRGRRVLVMPTGFPPKVFSRVVSGFETVPVAQPGVSLIELRATTKLPRNGVE